MVYFLTNWPIGKAACSNALQ